MCNRQYVELEELSELEKAIFNPIYENKLNFIHPHLNLELILNENCYLRNHEPITKYRIDEDYLKYVLCLLGNVNNNNTLDARKNFCICLYNIDHKLFKNIENGEEFTFVNNLLLYGLTFNEKSTDNLEHSLEQDFKDKEKTYCKK